MLILASVKVYLFKLLIYKGRHFGDKNICLGVFHSLAHDDQNKWFFGKDNARVGYDVNIPAVFMGNADFWNPFSKPIFINRVRQKTQKLVSGHLRKKFLIPKLL